MNDRQRLLLLQLTAAEGPLTSDQMARRLGVSSRTIKTDMGVIASELEGRGARLLSRRNRGYVIEVTDQERMSKLFNSVSLQVGMPAAADEEGRVILIAQKLVTSEDGILVDRLAEQMYLSRGALRLPLQEALRFCESFRLKQVSAPAQGIRVTGEECHLRRAMTELTGLHFHRTELNLRDEEYARWIACSNRERQDIRHVFLKLLRESPYAVRDSVSQRIAVYLILARNRWQAGMYLDLSADWIREVRGLPLFRLAKDIYEALDREFGGYAMDTAEISFLAIMLLTSLDVDLRRDPAVTAPFLTDAAWQIAGAMLERLRRTEGMDLEQFPNARELLCQTVLPMLAKTRYAMDGAELFNWGTESSYLRQPFEVSCARVMAGELTEHGCRIGHIDLAALSCYVTALLRQADYPVKPLRLVVTNAIGGDFGYLTAVGLRERWPRLVEKLIPTEMYAIRALTYGEDYDAILLGHLSDEMGSNQEYTYNFNAPMAELNPHRQGGDYVDIYNKVLVDAYRYEELVLPKEAFHYWEGFHYYDKEQTFQFLAASYGKDAEAVRKLTFQFRCQDKQLSLANRNVVVVMAQAQLCKEPCVDLYHLTKPGKWETNRIQWILFANYTAKNLAQSRGMAVALTNFIKSSRNFEQFAQAPRETFLHLLRESVQYS